MVAFQNSGHTPFLQTYKLGHACVLVAVLKTEYVVFVNPAFTNSPSAVSKSGLASLKIEVCKFVEKTIEAQNLECSFLVIDLLCNSAKAKNSFLKFFFSNRFD